MDTLLLALLLLGHDPQAQGDSAVARAGTAHEVPALLARREAWTGEDKARHFLMSYAVVALTYGGGRAAGLDANVATTTAVVTGAVAGVLKEVSDQRRGGFFSVRDLAWDAAGVVAGLLMARSTR
jgi:uncharacterized protein YfiM (DUF2279 family)